MNQSRFKKRNEILRDANRMLTYDLRLHQHRTLQIRPDFQYLKRRPFSMIDSQYTRVNASHAFEFRDTWRLISPTAERESATSPQFEIAANKLQLRFHSFFIHFRPSLIKSDENIRNSKLYHVPGVPSAPSVPSGPTVFFSFNR